MPSASDRRAPRVEASLDVFLQTVDGDVLCKTEDASYEGVFIVRPDPLPLRKLIRFRTRLPDSGEQLQMLGLVAHTVNASDAAEQGRDPGMGIQLFSLGKETRRKWREYVDALYEENPQARESIEASRRPDVRIRIPNEEVLDKFRTVDLPAKKIFVRTPELHPPGTEVDCVVTHPADDMEFTIAGVVDDVVEGTVKERGVRIALNLPQDTHELEAFVGGPIPDAPKQPARGDDKPPLPPSSDEIPMEELSESDLVSESEVEALEAEEPDAPMTQELSEGDIVDVLAEEEQDSPPTQEVSEGDIVDVLAEEQREGEESEAEVLVAAEEHTAAEESEAEVLVAADETDDDEADEDETASDEAPEEENSEASEETESDETTKESE